MVSEGFVFIFLTLYYLIISKNWIGSVFFGFLMNVSCSSITIFFLPESPMWLYDKKNYIECHKVFKQMCEFNEVKNYPKI